MSSMGAWKDCHGSSCGIKITVSTSMKAALVTGLETGLWGMSPSGLGIADVVATSVGSCFAIVGLCSREGRVAGEARMLGMVITTH